jgi:hypothetical protein
VDTFEDRNAQFASPGAVNRLDGAGSVEPGSLSHRCCRIVLGPTGCQPLREEACKESRPILFLFKAHELCVIVLNTPAVPAML